MQERYLVNLVFNLKMYTWACDIRVICLNKNKNGSQKAQNLTVPLSLFPFLYTFNVTSSKILHKW